MSSISPTSTIPTTHPIGEQVEVTNIGVVGFLNTIPLISGIQNLASISMHVQVPAAQIGMLESGEVDMALCSVIDLVHSSRPMQVVPAGMLGCAGKTLTVRLYSRVPIDRISRVHCDRDSHTSVELLKVILREAHGTCPEQVQFDATSSAGIPEDIESLLLIGDKVVTSSIPDHLAAHQMDLGEAWHQLTGLPFVFATWLCPAELDPRRLQRVRETALILDHMRRRNAIRLPELAARYAPRFGWDEDLARHYFVDLLRYDFDEEAMAGLQRFLELSTGSQDAIQTLDWD